MARIKQTRYPSVIEYEDELNDEFSPAKIKPRIIDGSYRYERNGLLGRAARFFWYRLVFFPIAALYAKLAFAHRIVGREKLLPYRKTGFFLYGNHTQPVGDALMPPLLTALLTTPPLTAIMPPLMTALLTPPPLDTVISPPRTVVLFAEPPLTVK